MVARSAMDNKLPTVVLMVPRQAMVHKADTGAATALREVMEASVPHMAATTRTPVAGPTAAMATVATVIEQNFTLIQLLGSQRQQLHDTMLVLFMCTKPFIICHISV